MIEPHDRAVGERDEFVVPLDDLHPVRLIRGLRVGVQRSNRRLRQVLAKAIAGQRGLKHSHTFGDEIAPPQAAVLIRQRHEASVGASPGRAPCVVKQEESEESGYLRIVGDRSQLPGQPDRLGSEVDVAAIALVEHQIESFQHRAQVAGTIQPDVAYGALGAANALRHSRFRHEVRLRDLAGGKSAYSPKC